MKITIDGKTIEVNKEASEEVKSLVKKIEKIIKPKRWRAKEGETYCFFDGKWDVYEATDFGEKQGDYLYSIGNYFQTKEQAEKTRDRQLALMRVKDWAMENCPFEPNWDDDDEGKHLIYRNFISHSFEITQTNMHLQTELPYFKSEKDAKRCIKENISDLKLIFNIEK